MATFGGGQRTNIHSFSMQINDALISRLEKLARLRLGDEERTQLGADLQRILDMVDQLQTLDTNGVEPLIYLNDTANVLRDDAVSGQFSPEQALQNAPQHDGAFFRVPKMIQ